MQDLAIALGSADTGTLIKSIVRSAHFVGLALGLGAATALDLIIVRFLVTGTITQDRSSVVLFASKIVDLGLLILWASGVALLLCYAAYEPDKLGNPKVLAKIVIVGVLTLNGLYIHKVVLPLIDERVGLRLFENMSNRQRRFLITSGAVSATSWYVPLVLGALPQINFVVSASTIILAYALILAMAILMAQGTGHLAFAWWLDRRHAPRSSGPAHLASVPEGRA